MWDYLTYAGWLAIMRAFARDGMFFPEPLILVPFGAESVAAYVAATLGMRELAVVWAKANGYAVSQV